MKLTKSRIDKIKYKGEKNSRCVHWDDDIKGFGLRVYPSGRKAFILSYRLNRVKRLLTLGDFGTLTVENARKLAKKKLLDVENGIDPIAEKYKKDESAKVSELCHVYLEKHAKIHKRSWKEDEKRINRVILPAIGKRTISSIVRHDVSKIHEQVGKTGKYEANRILALLSVMFEFARKEGYVSDSHPNPAKGITKYKEEKRDRWVKPEELPRLVESIDTEPNIYTRAAIWLYLLLGVRKSELLCAKWKDVDFVRNELRLGTTKAERIHYVPISKPAIEIFKNIPKQVGNPFVICGKNPNSHLVNINKPWRRIRKEAGLEDVRLHDLRRTVGSWLATSGHSLHLIGKVLNHSNASTTQIYAHLSQDPMKQAMEEHGKNIISFAKIQNEKEEKTG